MRTIPQLDRVIWTSRAVNGGAHYIIEANPGGCISLFDGDTRDMAGPEDYWPETVLVDRDTASKIVMLLNDCNWEQHADE